jgi:sucrose-phosphate synthase
VASEAIPAFVDLNLRAPWSRPDRVRWCLATARWLKLNEHELAEITSAPTATDDACERAARALAAAHGLHQVIVTRGAAGAIAVSESGAVSRVAAPVVDDLVDTVGAGDAASAVVCTGLLAGWPMDVTLARAVAFAADICRIQGATAANVETYDRHLQQWEASAVATTAKQPGGLYVLSLSVHGLVRGVNIELGRDADTGGQVAYVVDQARALAAHPDVSRVDLVSRLVDDDRIDPSYARPFERLADGAQIVRLPFGPARYLHKESLWPYLDGLLDEVTRHIRRVGRVPDVVHGHYADAGLVGAELAKVLGVPFFFTGHSLGRVKRDRLLLAGKDAEAIEERYHLRTRIEAEERALETATVVIASTRQEVDEQYAAYDYYDPVEMRVIPPGVDVGRFSPPGEGWREPAIALELARFLADETKPMILAIARPDERKNFEGLVEAYAMSQRLRSQANLVLVVGTREDIAEMPGQPRAVLTRLLLLIDRHDLYGSVAYPKAHDGDDVPELYRLAARSGGVFVNPAFTEPFGLTLLEAAATGLPVVTTNDGGPRDILSVCRNGLLVDANDPADIRRGLEEALASRERWRTWAASGLEAVHAQYAWSVHARRYVSELQRVQGAGYLASTPPSALRLPVIDRLLVVDIDDTLSGDEEARRALMARLEEAGGRVGFCVATGRTLAGALDRLRAWRLRTPDVLITATGTAVHYGAHLVADQSWERQIRYRWKREDVERALAGLAALTPGDPDDQTPYRLRYRIAPDTDVSPATVRRHVRQQGVHAMAIADGRRHLDVIPVRASPGLALRYLCFKWDMSPARVLVAGDSGHDADMLTGETLGVIAGHHTSELESLAGRQRVYFARGRHGWGVLEGIDRYHFLDEIAPDREVAT